MAQIDLHSHAITQGYLNYIKANGAEMDEGFPIPSWDAERHIAFMDKAGIQTSVLTMPAPQPFFGNAEASAVVCRRYNEECAALKARYPGRFLFCAALPLPDVPHALEEARYALEVLGADGIKLATNSYGQYLGDPALDTLMAYLDQHNAVIILHPHKPSAVNAQLIADVPLASYEYLAETSRSVLNMIAHNVLVRFPHLKVVVPHCGSFLPNALPRFRSLLPVMVKQDIMQPVDVDANLSRLYYDLAGAPTDDVLNALLTITTPDHILYGSDYPYVAEPVLVSGKQALEERLASHGLNPQDIFSDNARRLFGEAIPLRQQGEKIVRLAEIEVEPTLLEEYLNFAKEVGETSTRIEPGVLTLFSMQSKENPCKIYILEIYADRPMPYYKVLLHLNMKTIGDVERMRLECSDGAYQLALIQLAGTGLDIVAYSVALQNLCIVKILKLGFGVAGLTRMFNAIYGESAYNVQRADRIYQQATKTNLI